MAKGSDFDGEDDKPAKNRARDWKGLNNQSKLTIYWFGISLIILFRFQRLTIGYPWSSTISFSARR